jgi:hypothetical protein
MATTDKSSAIKELEMDERYGIDELDCIILDKDYNGSVPCYWYTEDKTLRETFASYRDAIDAHYKDRIEFNKQWDLFQDEFSLDN